MGKLLTHEQQQTTLQSPGKVIIKVCSLDPLTQTSAPITRLNPFQLLCFVCIIASGGICPKTVKKQNLIGFVLRINKQAGRWSDSQIKSGTDVRRVQNLGWAKFLQHNLVLGQNVTRNLITS